MRLEARGVPPARRLEREPVLAGRALGVLWPMRLLARGVSRARRLECEPMLAERAAGTQ